MRFLVSFIIMILIFGGQAWADCKSDCQNDYQSEVNSCRAEYSDPDDAGDLATCMDDAKKEYESCLAECETESDAMETRTNIDDRFVQKVERDSIKLQIREVEDGGKKSVGSLL